MTQQSGASPTTRPDTKSEEPSSDSPPKKYAILAGQGRLPRLIIEALNTHDQVFVVAFKGQTDPQTLSGCPHLWARLGEVGKILKAFRTHGVTHIVLAGGILRPALTSLRPDWQGLRLLRRMVGRVKGDNDILTIVLRFLEDEGFTIVAAHSVLPDLLAFWGQLNHVVPSQQDQLDLQQGFAVAKALGAQDVGQSVVVQDTIVLAVEAAEGTDEMLSRCAHVRSRLPGLGVPGGVLVKVSKPGQDLRADLPAIGVQTLYRAHEAGLRGIGLEIGKALIIDPEEVKRVADHKGLFVVGLGERGQNVVHQSDSRQDHEN